MNSTTKSNAGTRLILAAWFGVLAFVLFAAAPALAQSSGFNLRVEPPTPTAGEPFTVAVDGTVCDLWFVGLFEGFTYGGTRTLGNIVEARFGHYVMDMSCNLPATTARQTVTGLPAGQYRLDLISQFSPQTEVHTEFIMFTVAPGAITNASAVAVPAMGTWGSVVLLLAIGAVMVRRRAHQH
ncbi:MAG: hypothetical protein LKM32_04470 [Chiayiivirga sp.]|jgi:hypothetical protein|uniref:hypothetical protein n=1 Tax=Chiayiivirga sp. TaxID=2041042 RepID=UPI0025BA2D35|nr:hypothetical protein [Chiayiivirga sp.]MCI1728669.1 hypothetical protein [Chiayiivirga sp.]